MCLSSIIMTVKTNSVALALDMSSSSILDSCVLVGKKAKMLAR